MKVTVFDVVDDYNPELEDYFARRAQDPEVRRHG